MTINVLFLNDSLPVIRRGLASGFEELGHRVSYFGQHLWILPKDEQVLCVRNWLNVHEVPDIVLFEGFTGSRPIYPEAVVRFKEVGSRFYYWAIEDPLWTDEVIGLDGTWGPYALVADHIFTTAIECVGRYASYGRPSSVLQFGINPRFHRPVNIDITRQAEIVLVANDYSARSSALIKNMILPAMEVARTLGVRFSLYGQGWDNLLPPSSGLDDPRLGPLDYEALPTIYSGAQIVLGAEQCLNDSDTQSSMRVFEALGCGACYLGPRHRAHERMFDETEIALSDGPASTTDHLVRLLGNESARSKMADAGRSRCLNEHRYEYRARHVLDVFEGSISGGR